MDAESRILAPLYAEAMGARVLVSNVPGAGGITGARAIASSTPDGRTLGLINVPGLLVAALTGTVAAPNPARDFTILGRLARSWHVWATGASSPLRTLEQVLESARTRPLVFAINEVGSPNLVSIAVAGRLLGVAVEPVAGFAGTRNASLAAVRGEVDLVCFNFDTIADLIEAGELRPLLQISSRPIAAHPALAGVGCLGGSEGWARRRAGARDEDAAAAEETARVLVDVVAAGRVVVAPILSAGLESCLAGAVMEALRRPELEGAGRSLDVAAAAEARADVRAAEARAPVLLPTVRAAVRALRR